MKNENAVHWWKYAIQSVKKLYREKRKGYAKSFQLSTAMDKYYQRQFLETFVKIQMKATDITEKERKQYEKIVLIYDIQRLSKWLDEGLYQIERRNRLEAQKNKKGMLGGFFSWGPPKEEKKVSLKDQLAEIFKVVRQEILQGKLEEVKGETNIILSAKFEIVEGTVKLSRMRDKFTKENTELRCKSLLLNFKHQNNGEYLDAGLRSIELVGITEPSKEIIPIIATEKQAEELLKLTFSLTNINSENFIKLTLETVN